MIEIVVMFTVAIAAVHSDGNQNWLFGFSWYFFLQIKLSITKGIHSEMREIILESLFFKNVGRRASAMFVPVCLGLPKYRPGKWYIWECFRFGISFNIDQRLIRITQGE